MNNVFGIQRKEKFTVRKELMRGLVTRLVIKAIEFITSHIDKTSRYLQAIVKCFKKQFHKHIQSYELVVEQKKAKGILKEDKRSKRKRSEELEENAILEKKNKRPCRKLETKNSQE